jgi:hypothetical protein
VISNLDGTDRKYKHASTTGKKSSPFARAVAEIFSFFPGKLTFGLPYMLVKTISVNTGNECWRDVPNSENFLFLSRGPAGGRG